MAKEKTQKPFTRSRDGCFTCKEKKIKCDERLPSCTYCEKNRFKCQRGIRLLWPDEAKQLGISLGREGCNRKAKKEEDSNRSGQIRRSRRSIPYSSLSMKNDDQNTKNDCDNEQSLLLSSDLNQLNMEPQHTTYFVHVTDQDFQMIDNPTYKSQMNVQTDREGSKEAEWKNAYDRIATKLDDSSATLALLEPWLPQQQGVANILFKEPSDNISEMLTMDSDRLLMDYYMKVLCPSLSVGCNTSNGYYNIVLPLCINNAALVHVLLALSANHIQALEPAHYRKISDMHKERALVQLSESMKGSKIGPEITDVMLVTLLLLCYLEIVDDCQPTWADRLELAKKLLEHRNKYQRTPATIFCSRMFSYFDNASRAACRERALFGDAAEEEEEQEKEQEKEKEIVRRRRKSQPELQTQTQPRIKKQERNQEQCIDPVLGCSPELMKIVGQIVDLSRYKSTEQGIQELDLVKKRSRKLYKQTSQLYQWTNETDTNQALVNTAEAKRKAALVFIASALDDVKVEQEKLRVLVSDTLEIIKGIPDQDMSPALLWPLFVVASQAEQDASRLLSLQLFDRLEHRLTFRHIRRSRDVVVTVWKKRDLHRAYDNDETSSKNKPDLSNANTNDWVTIVQPLCWRLSLV